MGYEIDFLAVGDGERGGDAIAMRFGNLQGSSQDQVVIVIDGGTKETGEKLVGHINAYYKTNKVDIVISSHPDADHSSGLAVVLEKMQVGSLWMHRPWEHASDIKELFQNNRIKSSNLKEDIKKSLENAYELETIAKRKQISIGEPFSDNTKNDSAIVVLSPSKEFYQTLLANFRETPEPKSSVNIFEGIGEKVVKAIKEAINWIEESWGIETLTDPEETETSAENNSSVILVIRFEGESFLFAGDAGTMAIKKALEKAAILGIDLKTNNFIQIPHHGSKHNIGPTVLNSIIGKKLTEDKYTKTAFVSAPKEGDPKHPSRKVTNAFRRRGARVFATKGQNILHKKDAPERNWNTIEALPFYEKVAE